MRTINAFRNFITGFAGQLVSMLLSFASRTVFIYVLGEEYLGVNGLFSSILSVLSFSELGIGAAITYELYKPIADKDSEKIRSLMLFYKKAYFFIGSFILLAGLVLLHEGNHGSRECSSDLCSVPCEQRRFLLAFFV